MISKLVRSPQDRKTAIGPREALFSVCLDHTYIAQYDQI